ncbi:hypothetical protein ACMFMG_003240 [Clarireedia jacksonii]
MSARFNRMDSEAFEHVVQPLEDVKEGTEGFQKRDREDMEEEEAKKEEHISDNVLDTYNFPDNVRERDEDHVVIRRSVSDYERDFPREATRHERSDEIETRGRSAHSRRRSIAESSDAGSIDLPQRQPSINLSLEINRIPLEKWWANEGPVAETDNYRHGGQYRRGRRYSEETRKPLDMPFRGKNVLDVAIEEDKPVQLAINSNELQDELRRLTRVKLSDCENVLLPPWKSLVEYDGRIRERLESLKEMLRDRDEKKDGEVDLRKERILDTAPSTPSEEREYVSSAETSCQVCSKPLHAHGAPLVCLDTRVTHLQVLVDFMDTDLKPVFDLRRSISDGTIQEIAFADLWHLFNPGDLIVESLFQQAYRIFHTSNGRHRLPNRALRYDGEPNYCDFTIDCFHVDYDSRMLGPIHRTLSIVEYIGKRSIFEILVETNDRWVENMTITLVKMLPVEERKRQIENLIARGKKLRTLEQGMHKYYDGLDAEQFTKNLDDYHIARERSYNYLPDADVNREFDHITSDIIIGRSLDSDMKPIGIFRKIQGGRYYRLENCIHCHGIPNFENIDDIDQQCDCTDRVRDCIVDSYRANKYLSGVDLLKVRGPKDEIGDDHYMLLPPIVESFVLEKKQWMTLLVDGVKDIEDMPTTDFKNLILPDGYEKLLKAVVKSHSSSKGATSVFFQKCSALTILLHGPQSTGKRLTAKALASYFQRPIYSIDSYNLSISHHGNFDFAEHFRRASKWNAIILIQDAERYFLDPLLRDTRSTYSEMFLRELLQYRGIVILTAHRREELDIEIGKKINVALAYEAWDICENLRVWEQQLERLERERPVRFSDEARKHVLGFAREQARKGHNWNGKDIENYFDVSIALMASDSRSGEGQKKVEVEHLIAAARAVWTYC